MKKICYLFTAILLNVTVFAQVQSSCVTLDTLVYHYQSDVPNLALTRMFATKSPDTTQIEIPQIYIDSIWHGLSAIFNVNSIPERDSVFDIFCVHNSSTQTNIISPYIIVDLDTNVAWTSHWFNEEITTGYTALDNFTSNYNYSIFGAEPGYYVLLYSNLLINSHAVSDSLVSFNGILSAFDVFPLPIDGDKVHYSLEDGFQYFDFTKAWGDCLLGCTKAHQWKFRVNYEDCTVEYLGLGFSAGSLPDPVNCNITAVEENEITRQNIMLFPNPAETYVSISGNKINKVWFLSGQGKTFRTINTSGSYLTLDIRDLKPGVYFVKIESKDKIIVRKLIKN